MVARGGRTGRRARPVCVSAATDRRVGSPGESGPGAETRVGARAPLLLVSAALLLLEIYWLRAFAEAEWGHLASMVVSTAMLGFGAGAVAIQVAGERGVQRGERLWWGLLALFVGLASLAPAAAATLPFEPLLLAWRMDAWGWLLVRDLTVAAPFAAGAAAVTLALRLRADRPGSTYGTHLLGAGLGVALGLVLIAVRPTGDLHRVAVALGIGAWVIATGGPARRRAGVGLVGIAVALIGAPWSAPHLAEEKDLAYALRLPDAHLFADRPGIRGRWSLVTAPALHGIPGLSLAIATPPRPQRALFVRGDSAGVVLGAGGAGLLRHQVDWLPYALRSPQSVLLLDPGAGLPVQAALGSGAASVTAVVPDPRTRAALRGELGTFAGIDLGRVALRGGAPRAALTPDRRVDLVFIPAEDSLAAATGGFASGLENDLLTVEGIAAAFDALAPAGQVAVTRWSQAPPRDLPKLVATFVRVLARHGVDDPRRHLWCVRHWDAWVLCASLAPYTEAERRRGTAWADEHRFDPLLPEVAVSPHHRLPGPDVVPLLESILAAGDGSVDPDYPFHIAPATDDRPFFHRFLSWHRLSVYLRGAREGNIPFGDWGDLFLVAQLVLALLLGGGLIAAPALLPSRVRRTVRGGVSATLLFTALGFGYMFLEISFVHQGSRLTANPAAAATVVIGAFLLGSGCGSLWLSRGHETGAAGPVAAAVAAALALVVAAGLSTLFDQVIAAGAGARWLLLFSTAFAVALPLGMPFPAGLACAAVRGPGRIPWLVAVNGWASVVGAVGATLMATSLGFRALTTAAAALYALAALLLWRSLLAPDAKEGMAP